MGFLSWFFGTPNSLLVRQVAELSHELRLLQKDFEILDERMGALQGKVNVSVRGTRKKQSEDEPEGMMTPYGKLSPEQMQFFLSTAEGAAWQNSIKGNN